MVAAVIERQGSYLVCQRPFEKRHGGLWEFPGGKLLDGEGVKEAASRELHEELGVDVVTVGEPIFSLQDPGSPFLVMFCPVETVGQPTAKEHMDIRWVEAKELLEIKLLPADHQFACTLLKD